MNIVVAAYRVQCRTSYSGHHKVQVQQEAAVPKHLQSVLVTRAYWLQSSTLNDVAAALPHLTCSSSRTQPAYLLCSFCNHAAVSRSFPKKMSKLLRTMTRFNPKVCMHVLSVGQRNAASSGRNIAWRQHLLLKSLYSHRPAAVKTLQSSCLF